MVVGACGARSALAADTPKPVLPWEREISLKEAARSAVLTSTLDPQQPTQGANVGRFTLGNTQIRSSLWGPSDRVTLSVMKTDVWDRRYGIAPTLTLKEIREGVFSPANKDFDDMPTTQRRPVRGWLPPEGGGRVDRYACWNAYPFPCQKPVGQIILGMDELAGIANPQLAQSCADGVVRFELKNERAKANLQILLSMTRNVYAIRGHLEGVASPWLRLYRHEDQAWRRYMTDDKKSFRPRTPGAASGSIAVGEVRPTQVPFDYAKDAAWNGPIDPPQSGSDGRYFWIHQRFPAEKTFPNGFDYVLMGVVAGPGKGKIETINGQKGLGTPPTGVSGEARQRLEDGYKAIREASGSAATASLPADAGGNVMAYVTVVTCNDAADPMAEAKRRLDAAVADGFDKLVAENTAWYDDLYDRRENGRIFTGKEGTAATESAQEVFTSWNIRHGGSNKPDMRRYEATASYSNVEQDWQLWHSLPCYNEIFYTSVMVRNRADSADMWWKIIEQWRDTARANAKEVYGVPEGMMLVHGYVPPVKPDRYVHTNVALEYCIETLAQMVKVLWEEWDYGGDEKFLREKAYPAMRDTALFYMHYATKGDDGYYHFIPSMEAEAWGIFPEFKRMKDCISALCMSRWTFLRAAEAAEYLDVDADLRKQWLEMAGKIAPYPLYDRGNGQFFNSVDDTIPNWKQGDHGWYVGFYPTILADDINLDSSEDMKAKMIRTVASVPSPRGREALMLLGVSRSASAGAGREGTPPIEGGAASRPSGRAGSSGTSPEALLNSRSGRLYFFPDTPADAVVAFHNFQARGGFLVSAAKDEQGASYIEIQARRDGRCQVMNPWPNNKTVVLEKSSKKAVPFTIDKSNGECLVIPTRGGESYIIQKGGASYTF